MDTSPPTRPATVVDTAVRLGLLALLLWFALKVFAPFLGLMVWAIVLAIAIYPLNQKLASSLGTSSGRAATLLVLLMVVLLGVPTVMLSISLVDHVLGSYRELSEGTLSVPAPNASVRDWPLIGPKVFAGWQAAYENLGAFLADHRVQLRELTRDAAGAVGGMLGTALSFIAAFIVAGIMMAYAHPGAATTNKIFTRICGPVTGPELHNLSVATVRSVAVGVVGVAFIQSVLLGVGFLIGDVPAAGLLALIVLLLGIAQVPAAIIVLPVIAWLWARGDGTAVFNTVLTVYLLAAGLADNVLKPLMLGRGLAVPMPVILLGAIGGMIGSGIIGLFAGAVVLAVAYQLFMAWVNQGVTGETTTTPAE